MPQLRLNRYSSKMMLLNKGGGRALRTSFGSHNSRSREINDQLRAFGVNRGSSQQEMLHSSVNNSEFGNQSFSSQNVQEAYSIPTRKANLNQSAIIEKKKFKLVQMIAASKKKEKQITSMQKAYSGAQSPSNPASRDRTESDASLFAIPSHPNGTSAEFQVTEPAQLLENSRD